VKELSKSINYMYMKLLQKFDTTFFETQCIYPLYILTCVNKKTTNFCTRQRSSFFLKTRGGSEKARRYVQKVLTAVLTCRMRMRYKNMPVFKTQVYRPTCVHLKIRRRFVQTKNHAAIAAIMSMMHQAGQAAESLRRE